MKIVEKKFILNTTVVMVLISLVCPYIAHGASRRVQIIEDDNVVNVIVVDEKQRLADLPLKPNQRARFENNSNREDFKGPQGDFKEGDNGMAEFANLKGVKLIEKINIEDLKRPEDNRKLMVAVVDAIKELNLKMREIEATSTASVINGDGTFTTPVFNVFKNLGIIFEAGLTRMKALAVDTFTVGSRDNPAGITLHDEEGGAAFCVKIKNGSLLSIPGECKTGSATPPNNGQGGGGTQITTPPATTTPSTGGGSGGIGTTTPPIDTPATTTPSVNGNGTTTPSTGGSGSTGGGSNSGSNNGQASTTPTTPTTPSDSNSTPSGDAPVTETPTPTPPPTEPPPTPTPEPAAATPPSSEPAA